MGESFNYWFGANKNTLLAMLKKDHAFYPEELYFLKMMALTQAILLEARSYPENICFLDIVLVN